MTEDRKGRVSLVVQKPECDGSSNLFVTNVRDCYYDLEDAQNIIRLVSLLVHHGHKIDLTFNIGDMSVPVDTKYIADKEIKRVLGK